MGKSRGFSGGEEMKLKITRTSSNKMQTVGKLGIYEKEMYKQKMTYNPILINIFTLELPNLGNQQWVSRIPSGIYLCKKRWSWKHKRHIKILNVENRTDILIHAGSYYTNITGCILVGSDLRDINNDGQVDVINSRKTLFKMLVLLPKYFELEILDEDD